MIINKRLIKCDINTLMFLFPRYDIINENTIPEKPGINAIYNGDISATDLFIKKYQEANLDYLVRVFYSDIDLDNRRILANIIFEKWHNATVPKYLDNIIDNIQYNQFSEAAKIKWVSGKWVIHEIDNENSFLNIIESLNKSKYEFIKTYFECLDNNKPYILESSIITFLQKAKTKSYVGNSFQYRKKLEMYKDKKLNNTLSAIKDALEFNIDNPDLRLLNILINIQDSNKKS